MDLQTNGGKPVTSENVPSSDNLRAHSPQIPDDHRLQPDTQMGNVYDNDGRVLYLNGFHDNATEYVRCIIKPKAVFGTHTSLTTEQHSWLVPMPDGQSVRYSLLGRNRTTLCRPNDWSAPLSNTPSGRPPRAMIYARLDEAIADLDSRLGGLPRPDEAEYIWADLWHQEAHHSTAREGNTLILDQVRKLLDEGRAVGSKELREYMEVRGYADAARWVYGQGLEPGDWTSGDLLCLQEVRSVHHKAMTPVWDVAQHPHATPKELSLIHISEPTRLGMISYAVFCLKKK